MTTRSSFTALFVLILFGACSTLGVRGQPAGKLTLNNADLLKINASTLAEVKATFGSPDMTTPLKLPNREAWLYFDGEDRAQGRLIVHVDTISGFVKAVIWNMREGDLEQDPEQLKSRYPASQPIKTRTLYDFGHYFTETESLEDPDTGLTISYDSLAKTIRTVSRRDPKDLSARGTNRNGFPKITYLPSRGPEPSSVQK